MSGQALDQAAQGSGGVTIPGGVQKTCRRGTSGHGLAGVVVLGRWLDLMILEVCFRTWFSRCGGVGLAVGLDDLKGLFQPMFL